MSKNSSLIKVTYFAMVEILVLWLMCTPHARAVPFTLSDIQLNGASRIIGNEVHLTRNGAQNDTGSAFTMTPVWLGPSTSFEFAFSFQIRGGTGGADGFTFTLQNDLRGPRFLGLEGGNLGFHVARGTDGNPVPSGPAIAIAFDTYRNSDYGDAGDNQVEILKHSTYQVVAQVASPFDLNSGDRYWVFVDYSGPPNLLSVYLSNDLTKPAFPLLEYPIDLAEFLIGQAYVGFTGASGGLTNEPVIEPVPVVVSVAAPSSGVLLSLVLAGLLCCRLVGRHAPHNPNRGREIQ